MLKRIAEKCWARIPYFLRGEIVRSTQKKFTVSVVAVVTDENDQVLILDHFFRPKYTWGLPGGFLDPNEAPEQGIKRELFEEAHIKLENVKLLRVRTIGRHIEIIFHSTSKGKAKVNSREIRALGWFSLDALPEMSEYQVTMLKEVLSKEQVE